MEGEDKACAKVPAVFGILSIPPPSLPPGVPRSLGNPTDQKGKDVNEGGRGGRTRLPLVGLGLFDVLLLVATVVGVYQGHLADFWRDHYTE